MRKWGRSFVCCAGALPLTLLFLPGCALNDPQSGLPGLRDSTCSEARGFYTNKLSNDPDDIRSLDGQAGTYVCARQYGPALDDLTKAIALYPSAYEHELRADVFVREDDTKDALADLDRATQREPQNPEPYILRGIIYADLGDANLAVANLTKARDYADGDGKVLNEYAWIRATSPNPQILDASEAVKYAAIACQLTNWGSSHVMDTLAAALASAGNFNEAVKWQRKAIELQLMRSDDVDKMKARLALYQNKQPYREPPLFTI